MKTSWDLSVLYSSDTDPKIEEDKKEVRLAIDSFKNKWRSNTSYLNEPSKLKEALMEYENIQKNYGVSGAPGYYFWLRSQLDQLDTSLKAKLNKIVEFGQENANNLRFFELELGKVSESVQKIFLGSPILKPYHHFLERVFIEAKHSLGENEENILSLVSGPAYDNWTRMTEEFISSEERIIKLSTDSGPIAQPFGVLMNLMSSKDKKVRDQAGSYVSEINNKYASTAEHEINSVLQFKKIEDDLRGFKYPEESRYLSDDIEMDIVEAMCSTVENNFDLAKTFYAKKAESLGQSKLKYHERNVEVGEVDAKFSYEDTVSLVRDVLNNLDPEFAIIFNNMLDKGQLDAFPIKGKDNGAFCAMNVPGLPTYILLNHTDSLRDVTTMAHEMGHALNDEYKRRTQPALYCGSSLAVAEVASTFIEDFALEEITKRTDQESSKAIIWAKLNDDVSTIFRQVAAYRFEQELHMEFRQSGYVSKEKIGQIFKKHMASYMGSAVEQTADSENWWVYWSHFRRPFYVYSYASGLLISKALQRKVRENPKFIEKVKVFLSTGSSESPKETFAKLGIDISDKNFWQSGIDEVKELLEKVSG